MDSNDETRLIDDILDGEAAAYAVLVRRYQGPIYGLMLRLCKNTEDARDLTQDTFVSAYEKLERFKRGARFFPWLYTIGLNLGRDYIRKKKYSDVSSSDLPEGFMENYSVDLSRDGFSAEIDTKKILKAMDLLPMENREALLLRYKEDCSIADIAIALDMKESAVKMRISRGLDRLRAIVIAGSDG